MRNHRTTRRRTCSVSVARSTWVIGRAGRNAGHPAPIGLQIDPGLAMKVEFRDLRAKPLYSYCLWTSDESAARDHGVMLPSTHAIHSHGAPRSPSHVC
jgi:hypothetical protein